MRRLSSWSQFAAKLSVAPRSAGDGPRAVVFSPDAWGLRHLGSSGAWWCCLLCGGLVLAGLAGCSNSRAPGSGSPWFPVQSVGGQWEPEVDYEAERAALEREQQEQKAARKKPSSEKL